MRRPFRPGVLSAVLLALSWPACSSAQFVPQNPWDVVQQGLDAAWMVQQQYAGPNPWDVIQRGLDVAWEVQQGANNLVPQQPMVPFGTGYLPLVPPAQPNIQTPHPAMPCAYCNGTGIRACHGCSMLRRGACPGCAGGLPAGMWCHVCFGTGKCPTCGGTGTTKCPYCGGTGRHLGLP